MAQTHFVQDLESSLVSICAVNMARLTSGLLSKGIQRVDMVMRLKELGTPTRHSD